jgi:MraZ protein
MTLFLSTYVNRIDKKSRITVPSSFRNVLELNGLNGMVCYPVPNLASIEGCTFNRIKKISNAIDSLGPFSTERNLFSTSILADSHQVGFDKEGRVIIPSELLQSVGIIDEIAFVGMGETFQMWNPAQYNAFKKETQQQSQEKLSKLQWSNDN